MQKINLNYFLFTKVNAMVLQPIRYILNDQFIAIKFIFILQFMQKQYLHYHY